MFWDNLTKLLSFTGIKDITVWQDVAVSTILIPLGLIVFDWLKKTWNQKQPSNLVLNGFLEKNSNVLIFHSQMSGADDNWQFNPSQKYITKYPDPLPTDRSNLNIQRKLNIDPILSQAEADCLAEIYNILGRCGKIQNIISADMIKDWGKWSTPIISVGFNPKTLKLLEKCKPIFFKLVQTQLGMEIRTIDDKKIYNSVVPNDTGVIQKTFTKNGRFPVFILAGIGTAGTEVTGYTLNKNLNEFGKLYGSSEFCVFVKTSINEGHESSYIDKIYPHPKWYKILMFPLTYFRFKNKGLFLSKND